MNALPVVFERHPWGLVVARGADATTFLQAVVSQDLVPVEPGRTVASLLLHPQGKLDVAFRASRRRPSAVGEAAGPAAGPGADEWWLDTEPAYGPRLTESLSRYRIRVQVELDDRTATSAVASVVGLGPDELEAPPSVATVPTVWSDVPGCDVLGPADEVGAWVARSGLRVGDDRELEARRIEAGIPRLGVDVDDTTIPQEAFLDVDAVSFTKGCFIGQELVCRIDSRGRVNRFLRRLAIAGDVCVGAGAPVRAGDKVVGRVTSAAAVPDEARVVALAMIRREVEPPAAVVVGEGATRVEATVVA